MTFWQSSTCLSISDSVSFYSRAFPKWFSHLWPSLLPNTNLLLLQTWLQWIRNRLYKFYDEIKIPLGFFKIPNLPSSKRKKIILQKYLNSQHKLKIVCVNNTEKKENSTAVYFYVGNRITMAALYWILVPASLCRYITQPPPPGTFATDLHQRHAVSEEMERGK